MQRLTSTKLFKIGLLAFFFGLLIFFNPAGFFNPFRNIFLDVLLPFKKITYTFSASVEGMSDFLGSIGQLKTENEKLLSENQILLGENAMLADLKNENADLRSQLNLLPRNQFKLLPTNVVSQDLSGPGNWLEIDKGSDDGLSEGMAVIISKSILVGRIGEVAPKSSKVILLTNPKSVVNVATVQTGAKGVIKGEYGLGLIFDMILQTDSIQSGDEIVTSGIGGQLPRGLLVGTVQNVHASDDHLFQQATVVSPLQISKLQFVFVVVGNK